MSPERFQKLKQVLSIRQTDLTVMMDNVQKPHNMAAILRTCESIGIYRAHIITPERLHFHKPKAAAGVLRWIELERHQHQQAAFDNLKKDGFRLIAAHPTNDATPFRDYDYTQPTAILMGTERTGLTETAIAAADELITIPMQGLVQSLNVSVSAALILYEAQRQREAAGLYDQTQLDLDTWGKTLFEWTWPRIAHYCQENNLDYPELDMETGQIREAQAFSQLINSPALKKDNIL